MRWKGTSRRSLVPKCSTMLHLPLHTANVKCNKKHRPTLGGPFSSSANSCSSMVLYPQRGQHYLQKGMTLAQVPGALPVCPAPRRSSSRAVRHCVWVVLCPKGCTKLPEHQPSQPPSATLQQSVVGIYETEDGRSSLRLSQLGLGVTLAGI